MLTLEHLARLVKEHPAALAARVRSFALGTRRFDFDAHPAVMGVVNLSPDSWYRESVCLSVDAAIERGGVLRAQGADIIDVGAESTLAQAARVDADAQCARLLPVVRGLRERQIEVSVETYSLEVARRCLAAGAAVLNHTGGAGQEEIYRIAAEHDAAVIICFVPGRHVRDVAELELSADPVGAMYEYFAREVESAGRCGAGKLFLDPGLGFYYRNLRDSAERVRRQMTVFLHSFRLRRLGWPVCQALPHAFEFFREEVRCAEPFFAVLAALGKTDLFRTHEVARTRAVLATLGVFA